MGEGEGGGEIIYFLCNLNIGYCLVIGIWSLIISLMRFLYSFYSSNYSLKAISLAFIPYFLNRLKTSQLEILFLFWTSFLFFSMVGSPLNPLKKAFNMIGMRRRDEEMKTPVRIFRRRLSGSACQLLDKNISTMCKKAIGIRRDRENFSTPPRFDSFRPETP